MRSLLTITLLCWLRLHGQQWTQLPDFPGTPRDDAAAFTAVNGVYVGTGLDNGFQYTNDWYFFSMSEWAWSTVASLPASGRQYACAFAMEENGYLFGGVDASGPLNELWCYNTTTDTWTERTPLPGQGRYASAVFTIDDKAYVCTGMFSGGIPTNEVWEYDHVTDTWTQRAPVPGAARHRASAIMNMIAGGADADGNALADVHAYSPATNTWITQSAMPGARYAAEAAENLIIGGASSPTTLHAEAWSYDTVGDTWNSNALPPFPGGPRRGAVSAPNLYLMDVGMVFYGTGSDNQQRFNDWWTLTFPVGMGERTSPSMVMYPNPTTDRVTITGLPAFGKVRLRLLDNQGREVRQWEQGADAIEVGDLAAGHYQLIVETLEQPVFLRLIKTP